MEHITTQSPLIQPTPTINAATAIKTEKDHIGIDLSISEFDPTMCNIVSSEEVTDKKIAYIEREIRHSYEYKQYIKYLKTELDITSCTLLPELNTKDRHFTLEFHHYPFGLFDIVKIIINKHLATKKENESFSAFTVMEEVMKEHYDGNVGLVPLSKSMHQMAQQNILKIPADKVYGNVDKFFIKYKAYMDEGLINKYEAAQVLTEKDCAEANKDKLERATLNYNIEYHKEEDKDSDK